MKSNQNSSISYSRLVLPWTDVSSITLQFTLVISAVVIPAIAHLSGMPVRLLVPMHWPVLLAGLLLGWRGGLIVGLLAPISNFVITGYPLFYKMIPMTAELAVYGGLSGFLREVLRWNGYLSIISALIIGRIAFLVTIFLIGGYSAEGTFFTYVIASMTPGLIAAVLQALSLPSLAKLWVGKFGRQAG